MGELLKPSKSVLCEWSTKETDFSYLLCDLRDSLVAQMVKHLPAMPETEVQSLGWEDPLEKENGSPLQYSCLENPMDGGAW